MESVFKNCIITGSAANEFTLLSKFQETYRGEMQFTYIKKPKEAAAKSLPIFSDIYWSQLNDTVFKSTKFDYEEGVAFDFTPDSVSPARGLSDPLISAQYPLDLQGKNRLADGAPDAGAYEWYPTNTSE